MGDDRLIEINKFAFTAVLKLIESPIDAATLHTKSTAVYTHNNNYCDFRLMIFSNIMNLLAHVHCYMTSTSFTANLLIVFHKCIPKIPKNKSIKVKKIFIDGVFTIYRRVGSYLLN